MSETLCHFNIVTADFSRRTWCENPRHLGRNRTQLTASQLRARVQHWHARCFSLGQTQLRTLLVRKEREHGPT